VSEPTRKIPQALWERTPSNVFRTDLTTDRLETLERLRGNAIEFKDICRINYGAQISSKTKGAFGRDRYLAKGRTGMEDPKKFYEGSNMRPFAMLYDGVYVDMGRKEEMYGPRTAGFFESDKLSVRHISGDFDSFVAWVDKDHYYTDHGVIHAVPYHALKKEPIYKITEVQKVTSMRYPLFYLLGILMSRSALALYSELYATGSLQGAFSHVYPNMVKSLPVPKLNEHPGDEPDDWFDRLAKEAKIGRLSRTAVGRALRTRSEVAAALTGAARRRQEREFEREKRRRDFVDFMGLQTPGWHWKRGESLEAPPDEMTFLRSLGDDLISINTMNVARSEFRAATVAAQAAAGDAAVLQGMIDALAATLYATRA
jgi:TaqI-like C-terminal specificity domain